MVSLNHSHFEFHPDLDSQYLHKLYRGNLAYALDMFELFQESIDEGLKGLLTGYTFHDRRKIGFWLHKLRPCYAMVGLTNLFEIARELEEEKVEVMDMGPLCEEIKALFNLSQQSKQLIDQEVLRMRAAQA